MKKQEMMEKVLAALADKEEVKDATEIFHKAFHEACDKAQVPSATVAMLMAAATALAGAPAPIQVVLLNVFMETVNAMSDAIQVGSSEARVAQAAAKGGKEPMGFRFAQAPAKC